MKRWRKAKDTDDKNKEKEERAILSHPTKHSLGGGEEPQQVQSLSL
jgi:hypothetical protein